MLLLYTNVWTYLVLATWAETASVFKVGFIQLHLCHLQDRIDFGLIKVAAGVSGDPMECSRACMYDEACYGFSTVLQDGGKNFSRPGECYIHQEYYTHEPCGRGNADMNHVYLRKYGVCYNRGTWSQEKKRCICDPSTFKVGHLCTAHPRSCWDLAQAGYIPYRKSFAELQPFPNEAKVRIKCQVLANGISTTFIGVNRAANKGLNVSWSAYEQGFGRATDSLYWLGLRTIQRLIQATGDPVKLDVVVFHIRNFKTIPGTMTISNVQMSDASDGYRLTYQGHEATYSFAGLDSYCFRDSNGVRFSTFDADHDNNATANCAALNGGGGWFHSCESPCNIFGLLYQIDWKTNKSRTPYSIERIRLPGWSVADLSYILPGLEFQLRG